MTTDTKSDPRIDDLTGEQAKAALRFIERVLVKLANDRRDDGFAGRASILTSNAIDWAARR
jgi:hypothetical protein